MAENNTPLIKAIAKDIRISPRKVAVVADLVRRRTVADALVILEHTERKAALPIIKVINSAVANARHNLRMSNDDLEKLVIKTIMVTEGSVKLKRYAFVGTGRRARPRPMLKRSSHITVVLTSAAAVDEKKKEDKKEVKTPATKASAKPVEKTTAKPAVKKEVKK
ncbi:MAG: 50S ribosomal protein L22 [Candidatus Nomurabacteria bacterium]|nr:MAG: 50S ribosomal protein L22 [Candidatus Nomurabacteria bacterium]